MAATGRAPPGLRVIKFYGHTREHGELSNFFPAPFVLDGRSWPTTEHYFQAMKFNHVPDYMEKIRQATTPAKSKQLGATRSVPLRDDWEEVKNQVMLTALRAKFSRGPLKRLLLKTGDAYLIEHTTKDAVWGDGGDGSGENRLGVLLMQVRSELAAASKATSCDSAAATSIPASATANAAKAQGIAEVTAEPAGAGLSAQDEAVESGSAAKVARIEPHDEGAARGAPKSHLVEKSGDLLTATEQALCQQCNCVSRKPKGLAEALFAKYPHADIYSTRSGTRTPGTISVHGPHPRTVVNLLAQRKPGKPTADDTAADRLRWFKQCLNELAALPDIHSYAFPDRIGCGLAGGDWSLYRPALETFAVQVAPKPVVIYKL